MAVSSFNYSLVNPAPFAPLQSAARPAPANAVAYPDAEIRHAIELLKTIRHLPGDEAHMRSIGVDMVFHNGQEAYDLLKAKGVNIAFGDMQDSVAHAEWNSAENKVIINQKYRGDFSRPTLYAIAQALYHEAGHVARSGDGAGSIQEEINCLALNTLAYRYNTAVDPSLAQSAGNSRLISDGVALYPKLFFDTDPEKTALVNRVIEKYGMLPVETPDHPVQQVPGGLAIVDRVVRKIHDNMATHSELSMKMMEEVNRQVRQDEKLTQEWVEAQQRAGMGQKVWTA